ncbi:hypothetical protein [Microbacterium sp. NPDC057944]|uniref:DUF7927 domain-containing protein n=1 Tax=Microbacterium sp. NPDC057944 TaxID=3346286 RepID=UPI0036DF86DD
MRRSPSRRQRPWGLLAFAALLLAALPLVAPPTPAAAESNATNATVRGEQTWYVYVKQGEYPHVDFTKAATDTGNAWGGGSRIVVTDPGGTEVFSCDVPTTASAGTSCTWTGGVTSAPAPADGVYSVTLTRPVGSTSTARLGPVAFRWTIDARTTPTSGTQSGRVWTESYGVRDSLTTPVDLDLWYQTAEGFTYEIRRDNMTGIDSRFEANAFGNVDATTCTPAYHSITQTGTMSVLGLDNGTLLPLRESTCAFSPYKIFFAAPSADLPARVALPDGSSTWLLATPPSPDEIRVDDLRFTASEPGSRAGTISFAVPRHEGRVLVQVDVDDDGDFAGPADRTFPVSIVSGLPASLPFDGLDELGQPISTLTPLAVRVHIENTGEVHFVDDDVERMSGGVKVERLNGPASDRTAISWNDELLVGPTQARNPSQLIGPRCSTTPVVTATDVDSALGVHGWGQGACTGATINVLASQVRAAGTLGSWGNLAVIDRWTSVAVDKDYTLEVPAFAIEKTADPASGTALAPGDEVGYHVHANAVRYSHLQPGDGIRDFWFPAQSWSGRFTDDVASVSDNAVVAWGGVAAVPAAHSTLVADPAAGLITWTGADVPIDEVGGVSYTATVRPSDELGGDVELHNIAYVHTSTTPPGAPAQCTSGLCGQTSHPVSPEPGFALAKTSDPQPGTRLGAGQHLSYTVTGSNTGNTDLVDVTITDDLRGVLDDAALVPGSLVASVSGAAVAAPVLNGDEWTWTGSLARGESVIVSYEVVVNADAQSPEALDNRASAIATPLLPDPDDPQGPWVPGDPIAPGDVVTTHPVGSAPGTSTPPQIAPGSTGLANTGGALPITGIALSAVLLAVGLLLAARAARRTRR